MARNPVELEVSLDSDPAGDQEDKEVLRRCRGRPRLTDSDRAQRRLESRKKYDVRRVYLGESHKLWSEVRRRTSLSDAGLAEYLILLNNTYGEKYQQEYCGKKIAPEVSIKQKKGRKDQVSSLQSLVSWYQDHCRSCPHEPQLRALEPQMNFSTAAIWQCDSNHSFVQYLCSPPREAKVVSRKRRKDAHKQFKDVRENVSEGQQTPMSPIEEAASVDQQPREEASCGDVPLTGQPVWEMEMEMEQHPGSPAEEFPSDEESGSVGSELSVPLNIPEQSEMFDPHSLQTVLIIITGPSYEALASEGIQLNMGGGNVEEVTCTVIGGVSYNQVCSSDSKLRAEEEEEEEEEEDSMTGLSDKQLLQPAEDSLDLSSDRELQRSLSSVRSKRNRRGPVIEADGMLKMFHCPYEGCSQVYVAISSFQNHVNLVHRKGRTKVCPHPGCGKKFYLSNHLHRHMIIHSGVRDFICETCGKSFKRKNHLEVHRRTHTGETPLQCEICGYQCRQRASLNWHMKKHTSEAHYNFTCEFCEKRFEKLDSVKFHKLKSHPDKLAT
ncbi:Zinc finger protein 653 [Dissostichus eleginoides]|uniref:Zinc finger protein 653 n=1 Tax=Dissostichus eleginoides TaxID=100907 RepID=A0AAD9EU04_DISEL|nr:Zinc finger protein 653 [Dissostichus eleginoides]